MSRGEAEVRSPEVAITNDNAAKRRAKALARQRKVQQRRMEIVEEARRSPPRRHAPASPPRPVAVVHPVPEAEPRPHPEPRGAGDRPDVGPGTLLFGEVDLVDVDVDLGEERTTSEEPLRRAPRHRRHRRRRRSRLGAIAAAALCSVGGFLAWRTFVVTPQATVTLEVTGSPAVETLVVATGTTDLAALSREARMLGRPDALQHLDGETYLLSMPVTIRTGGHVELNGTDLRLRSEPGGFVGLEARGGTLTLRGASVTSWDPAAGAPDTDVTDGRAYILARDGARMDVVDSSASMLGYDAFERYGIAWRTAGTDGLIDESTLAGNFYGAYMHEAEPMEITDSIIEGSVSYGLDPHSGSRDFTIVGNTFRNNGKHGMILAEDCTGAVVRGNESYGNAEHGMVVFSGSDDTLLEENRVHDNGLAGISVNGADGVTVRENDVWANTTGIAVQDEATGAVIDSNRVSGNREDGVLVSSEQSTATVMANRLDHNGRAGVWVSDGQATIGPDNRISNNESGVRLVDETPSVRAFDNLLSENYKDGFSLVVRAGLDITGNRVVDNDAAFSVRSAGLATPFLAANDIKGNELGPERVREPDTQVAPEVGG